MQALHPEFESRYSALGDLSRPDAWHQRADIISKSFLKKNPEPTYRRSSWFWTAVGITKSSELWQEITLAATASPQVAEAHILGLPARLSCLIDTNMTGRACGKYRQANRGAMDGTSIGTISKELDARKKLSTQCKAVVAEISIEQSLQFGGAGPRLLIMHAEISRLLDICADCPETRESFDNRWRQWYNSKLAYTEELLGKVINSAREDLPNRVQRTRIYNKLDLGRQAKKRLREEELESESNERLTEEERLREEEVEELEREEEERQGEDELEREMDAELIYMAGEVDSTRRRREDMWYAERRAIEMERETAEENCYEEPNEAA